jgi:hypothetical protein
LYFRNDIFGVVRYGNNFSPVLDWTQDESLRIMLAGNPKWFIVSFGGGGSFCCLSGDCRPVSEPVVVLKEQYNQVSAGVEHPPFVELVLPDVTSLASLALVLEWTVTLADGVVLNHELAHVASLPVPVQIARWVAWGHLFVPMTQCVPALSASGKYRFSGWLPTKSLDALWLGG